MKKITMMVAVAAVAMISTAAFGQDSAADLNRPWGGTKVPGEKLDSGLGTMIWGESLDSGLGELSKTYTAAEYMPAYWVLGESMDSGLGDLPRTYTAAEYMPVIITAKGAAER